MGPNRLLPLAVAAVLCAATPSLAAYLTVDTPALQKILRDEPRKVYLLDVRTPGEYASGRIPGSVPIPMNQVERRLAEIPRDRKVVVVCASGARSAAVARFLSENGYPWVANYGGGVMEWSRSGLPIER